jgi:cytidylate kinase
VAPLKPAIDAVKLTTDNLGLEEVVDRLESLANGGPEKGDL